MTQIELHEQNQVSQTHRHGVRAAGARTASAHVAQLVSLESCLCEREAVGLWEEEEGGRRHLRQESGPGSLSWSSEA